METFTKSIDISKIDAEERTVFGWGIVSKYYDPATQIFKDFYDTEGDYFDEDGIIKAAGLFMEGDRLAYDSHGRKSNGQVIGKIIHAFPLTEDVLKSFDMTSPYTGLLIGMRPNAEVLTKYMTGEYTSFSVGGQLLETANA